MSVQAIPTGCGGILPSLVVRDGAAAIDFYRNLFGATEISRMPNPNGQGVMHAELRVYGTVLMLGDENAKWGALSPLSLNGPSPVTLMVYVPDVDSLFNQAVALGAKPLMPPANMFWGDRYAKITDPFGHQWGLLTHIEDVPPQDMSARAEGFFKDGCGAD